MRSAPLLALLLPLACGGSNPAPPESEPAAPPPTPAEVGAPEPTRTLPRDTTPNAFLQAGAPTFVLGTAGDAASARRIAGQARLVAGMFFPTSDVITDAELPPSTWPEHPVLYGGPADHTALAVIAPGLPFEMTRDRLVLGDRTFEGPGVQLVTVLPLRTGSYAHPELLLYAGTGDDGVAEINALTQGNDVIVVGDAFGVAATGRWVAVDDETLAAELGPGAPRPAWREVARTIGEGASAAKVTVSFLADTPADASDDAIVDAVVRGLQRAAERLQLASFADVTVYVYPDAPTKRRITGNAGHGHAVPAAAALHVLRFDPSPGGALESLLVHEGTHVLVRATWGAAGSPLLGEGAAVWAAGAYGGRELQAWRGEVEVAPIPDRLGRAFFTLPEATSYPFAGWVMQTLVDEVGLAKVAEHLYGATAASWDAACRDAGTSAEAIQAALARKLGGP